MIAKSRGQSPTTPRPPLSITWGNTGTVIHTTLGEAVLMALQRQEDALPEKVRIKKAQRRARKAALKKAREEIEKIPMGQKKGGD